MENKGKINTAFTLTETLITIVILGIVAAILVPNLIKNQVENANRTKIKKAMASYEKAINYMIIENDIRETEALRELGQNNCQYTREYFKTVKDGTNNCIFKTADRVWWDITDITNPIISLKDEITDSNKAAIRANALSYNADTTSFALVGRFDDLGTLRVNDNAYEQGLENNLTNQKYVGKLWYFITQSPSVLTGIQKCQAEGATTCTITSNGISVTYTKITTTSNTTVDQRYNGIELCLRGKGCGYVSKAPANEYWISDNLGRIITEEEAKSAYLELPECGSQCTDIGDYHRAAIKKCQNLGGHLATLAELKIALQNGKLSNSSYKTWFASEETAPNNAYTFGFNGTVTSTSKKDSTQQVICVGE